MEVQQLCKEYIKSAITCTLAWDQCWGAVLTATRVLPMSFVTQGQQTSVDAACLLSATLIISRTSSKPRHADSMTSESDSYVSPYEHQPLGNGQIRLLGIKLVTEPSLQHIFPWIKPQSTLHLETSRHELDEGPWTYNYEAVSYVWGTATASMRVECNGATLLVTPTVYQMLEHLQSRQIYLWIDAICIDQQNSQEKAIQIPLMHRVYSQAMRVIVWLGSLDPCISTFMRDLPKVSELAKTWIPKDVNDDPYWRGKEWPPEYDPFWRGYYHIATHAWFRRLWTFQEVILAEEVLVIHGAAWMELRCFLEFWRNRTHELRDYTCISSGVVDTLTGKSSLLRVFNNSPHLLLWRWLDLAGAAIETIDLPSIFYYLRLRESKEQVDRIWSIAGILPERIRNRLSAGVDCSPQGLLEYWVTFILFAKVIFEEGQSLALLSMPPSYKEYRPHLPSWCPNFYASEALCHLQINHWWRRSIGAEGGCYRTWFSIEEKDVAADDRNIEERRAAILGHSMKSIQICHNDTILHVRGFVVDTITEVVDGAGLLPLSEDHGGFTPYGSFTDESGDVLLWTFRLFFIRALDLAQRTCGSHECATKVPQEFVTSLLRDSRLNTKANKACEDLFRTFRPGATMKHRELDAASQEAVEVLWRKVLMTIGHSFFATECGRFGMATPGCNRGHKICVFYGGEPLYVLPAEGTGTAAKPVVFGGTAFIPHLMDQDQRDAAKLSEDQIFAVC